MQQNQSSSGFFGALFDFSFSRFVTSQLVSVLYVIFLILVGLGLLVSLGSGVVQLFQGDFGGAFLTIIVSPLIAIFAVVIGRVYLELIIVIFKIAENTKAMVVNQEKLMQKES